MYERVRIVGHGRVGTAVAARLAKRGVATEGDDPDLVCLCVPDGAIAEVAQAVEQGPWIAHVSGATPLAALDPHVRRFSLHPLQTIVAWRGPEQLDGAWAAAVAETGEARAAAHELAGILGLQAFDLADGNRAIYHAGAAFASNFLVALHRTAASLFELAGAPPESLVPLMRRTIENRFELTGPIERGDWATVDAHLEALRTRAPHLEPVYRALAQAVAT